VGAQFTVATQGGIAYFLVDNGAGDTDPTPNSLKMTVPVGTLNVCQTVAPTDYVPPSPTCQSVMVGGIVPAKLTFVDKTVAIVTWSVLGMDGKPVGGATFVWHDSASDSTVVEDDSVRDLDKTPDRFMVTEPNDGGGACPLTPPKTWVFSGNRGCFGMPARRVTRPPTSTSA